MNNYLRKIKKDETYLGAHQKKNYFEGWYFKIMTNDKKETIAFIPGITKGDDAHAFIQVVDSIKSKAYYFRYSLEEFSFSNDPFYIKIGPNFFSLEKIILSIKELKLSGELSFLAIRPLQKNLYSPNIMGPFAYLPFMECNHAVISLGHMINGTLQIYKKKHDFTNGSCYIEKDYGTSFPKRYIWLQGSGSDIDTNLFLSIATIPFKLLTFKGFIAVLMIKGKEYRFATYNHSKVVMMKQLQNDHYLIKIKKGSLLLEVDVKSGQEITLVSPHRGRMNDKVKESLDSLVAIKLFKKEELLFDNVFIPATSEILW